MLHVLEAYVESVGHLFRVLQVRRDELQTQGTAKEPSQEPGREHLENGQPDFYFTLKHVTVIFSV